MNKNEQDMIRKIKEKSEQVPVPKALEPRQIEAKLAGKKKKVWTPARISGLAAACLVLIVGVMVYQNYFKMEDATRDDKIACSDVTISDSTKVESAAEYKDVYAYLEKYKKDQERDSAYTSSGARSLNDIRVDESADSKASGDAAQNIEESSTAAADTGMASGSYSETNVRQEGVDEGDTAKTDGTYLYVLKDKSDQIAIIDTRDNRMKQTATITVEDVSEIQEMYLDIERNQLIAVCDGYVGGKWNDDDYGYGQRANTTAVTYDISDRENPKEVGVTISSSFRFCFFCWNISSTVEISFPCRSWMVESAFGSQPICMTLYPFSASATARLDTVVDFPIPPFPYTAIFFIPLFPPLS